MPTRLLREGILTSDRVDTLDPPAEVFYRRLMSKVDDHGLYDARPSILRSMLYPLRVDRVREADISRWMAACQKAGLIALYQHDGKPYLQMLRTGWQARSEAKFPLPAENTCLQPQTPVAVFGVGVVVEDVVPAGPDLFDEFWQEYPKKKAKDEARKAFVKRKPDRELLVRMLAAIREQVKTPDWQKDGGQFIPHPATWLNDGRWQDEATVIDLPKRTEPDPELARLEADRKKAVPPSLAVLERMAKIRQGVKA